MNHRRVGLVAGGVLVVLVALELAAVPIATRVLGRVVAQCVAFGSLEVTDVDRPVLPRLLVGRARGVELRATDLVAGPYRIAEAELRLPEAVLPWAIGADGEVATASLDVRADEAAVEDALREVVPFDLPVELTLREDVAEIASPLLPFDLRIRVSVDEDGMVRLTPARGGQVLERLGLAPGYRPDDAVHVTAVEIDRAELRGSVDLEVVPGVGGGGACEEPLAAPRAMVGRP